MSSAQLAQKIIGFSKSHLEPKMVLLVIYLHNYFLIPDVIPELEKKRKKRITKTGREFISPKKNTRDTSAKNISEQLKLAGYNLAYANWEEEGFNEKKTYYKVKFFFVQDETESKAELETALTEVLESALWSVRGFNNPFYKNGVETNERMISLNLGGRRPLYQEVEDFCYETQPSKLRKGQPVMVWPKNKKGGKLRKKDGAVKIPLAPSKKIVIENNRIQVVPI